MNMKELIEQLAREVESRFAGEGSGHDWEHIRRVWKNATALAHHEGADQDITALGALLHDIADHKFHGGDLSAGPRETRRLLQHLGADEALTEQVAGIVNEVTYKGAGVATPVSSLEAACVQDADRLDAIGAIGIARAFAYGGSKGRPLHSPNEKVVMHADFDSYAKDNGATTRHFYEKLLLLKDRMQTKTGKIWAEERHRYMEDFLRQFYKEWEGEKIG